MVQVVWLEPAEQDLLEVYEFIARDSERRAEAMVRRIREATDQLRLFPLSGRVIPERRDPTFRELIVEPFRVMYRHEPGSNLVAIASVIHGRRLPPGVITERP